MRNCLLPVTVFFAASAFAQAPVQDRSPRGDPITDAQQRVEFARQAWERSEKRAKEAERSLREAQTALGAVQKQYEETKSMADKAQRELAQARQTVSESRKAYETRSSEFERVRRGDTGRDRAK